MKPTIYLLISLLCLISLSCGNPNPVTSEDARKEAEQTITSDNVQETAEKLMRDIREEMKE